MSVEVSVDNNDWETGDAPNAPNDIDLKLPQWTSTLPTSLKARNDWEAFQDEMTSSPLFNTFEEGTWCLFTSILFFLM